MNNPGIKDLVLKALSMGLPMPLNWEQDDELTDSASPEEQESVQAEDDPDDKEVLDCGSQTTEDCHGGLEATRSIEDSPSVAENGQEDRDSDQTENGGEGEDGQEDRDSDQTQGEKAKVMQLLIKWLHFSMLFGKERSRPKTQR